MIPLLFRKNEFSFWKEATMVLCVLSALLILPVVAVFSVTNVHALVGSGPDGGNGSTTLYTEPANVQDNYDYGNCTYWAALRRIQVGEPIPNNWGNAATWATNAFFVGYKVDHTPSQNAIMQISNVDNGLGHVAFVESVDPDGTWHISEMNVVGFDEIDDKAMPASAAASYSFIHEKTEVSL